MKNILFIVEHNAHFRAPLLLIKKFKKEKKFNPIVFFCITKGYNFTQEILTCKALGIEFTADNPVDLSIEETVAIKDSYKVHTDENFGHGSQSFFLEIKKALINKLQFIFLLRYYYFLIKYNFQILNKYKIDLVITPEDNVSGISCFIRAAKKKKIPSIVLPFTLSNENEFLTSHQLYKVNTIFRKYFCLLFPKWKHTYKGIEYMTKSLSEVVIMELLGIAPVQPWVTMGGRSDYLLAESTYVQCYYKDTGVNPDKIILVGAIYQDRLYKKFLSHGVLKSALIKQYALDPDKPIILCGLHPVYSDPDVNFESTGLFEEAVAQSSKEDFDFKTLGEMTDFWVESLSNCSNYQVIIHNHPRTNLEKVRYIEKFGVKIVEGDISDFLPLCDIYVSGVSATIRMAVACGKPVICYTMGYYYEDYENFKAVFKVSSRSGYKEILNKITNDQDFYEECKKQQELMMPNFCFRDNKSGDRINGFFESILQ